jgi:hypothetical protein
MISKIRTSSALTALILITLLLENCNQDGNEVTRAVKSQLERYPESSLQDIYKSFFQDEFGPGHLLTDTAGAWQYLEDELSEMTSSGNHAAEPCGTGKNFYRVPLDLVKDGVISDSSLFRAFMESASSFRKPDLESWKKKWKEIELVIEDLHLDLRGFKQDREALAEMFAKGETAVHHSMKYDELYQPHYRIVGKKQWEKLQAKHIH